MSYSFTVKNTMSAGPTRRGIVGGLDARQMEVAVRAVDAKAALAQRGEVRAAREERDVGARRREPAAEIAADAAGADNRDAHSPL